VYDCIGHLATIKGGACQPLAYPNCSSLCRRGRSRTAFEARSFGAISCHPFPTAIMRYRACNEIVWATSMRLHLTFTASIYGLVRPLHFFSVISSALSPPSIVHCQSIASPPPPPCLLPFLRVLPKALSRSSLFSARPIRMANRPLLPPLAFLLALTCLDVRPRWHSHRSLRSPALRQSQWSPLDVPVFWLTYLFGSLPSAPL